MMTIYEKENMNQYMQKAEAGEIPGVFVVGLKDTESTTASANSGIVGEQISLKEFDMDAHMANINDYFDNGGEVIKLEDYGFYTSNPNYVAPVYDPDDPKNAYTERLNDVDEDKIVDNSSDRASLLVHERIDDDGNYVPSVFEVKQAAENGEPIHAFMYVGTEQLEIAAEKYAQLEDGEMYSKRAIYDDEFVEQTLDFFTGGNYTEDDINRMKDDITSLVIEMAEQLKDGGEIDYSKLETKISIAGVNATMGEILEFQEAGKELKDAFYVRENGSGYLNTNGYAEMGMALAAANSFGDSRGELGAMFSNAMSDLCDKGLEFATKNIVYGTAEEKAEQAMREGIMNDFANMNTSSASKVNQSFDSAWSKHESRVTNYCKEFDSSKAWAKLDQFEAELMKTLSNYMKYF